MPHLPFTTDVVGRMDDPAFDDDGVTVAWQFHATCNGPAQTLTGVIYFTLPVNQPTLKTLVRAAVNQYLRDFEPGRAALQDLPDSKVVISGLAV